MNKQTQEVVDAIYHNGHINNLHRDTLTRYAVTGDALMFSFILGGFYLVLFFITQEVAHFTISLFFACMECFFLLMSLTLSRKHNKDMEELRYGVD